MVNKTTERLVRLLSLVAYLEYHDRVPVAELAERFNTTPTKIREDVNLLWIAGLPGGMPGDLIDFDAFDFEDDLITLSNSQGVHRSFGLSDREAIALSAALQAMRATVSQLGIDESVRDLIDDTLEALTATEPAAYGSIDIAWTETVAPGVYAVVEQGLINRRRLSIDYSTATDERDDRVVEPIRLTQHQGHGYLDAWCTRANEVRRFRLDRIHSATLLAEPSSQEIAASDLPDGRFDAADGAAASVRVTFGPAARAVAETVPYSGLEELEGGSFAIELNVVNDPWFRQLLLSYADQVRDVSPGHWGDEARESAARALAQYGS
ncbi:YafY family protein [Rarobacter faecitabidus]|uniref:Proteasome accessory factor C n=1 Tax=Rarobacter faecitabidus TaxID=13243 RepID=A0A542ZW26_RARFA|nr:WYL domain-containing protein [Rarobacter faecitabidus]TQL64400.1 proteasome accessory factor C [Rarobacter faecitabidus]